MTHRILLVDDEPMILTSLGRVLRREGFDVLSCASPVEAMMVVDREQVDAVVSDQEMPEMDGTDLLAWVYRNHPTTVRFVLTGRACFDVALAAINKGAAHRFFTKPCNHAELSIALRQALKQKDLLELSRELLSRARAQETLLAQIEERSPGLTRVCRDDGGAVVLSEPPVELDGLLEEMDEVVRRLLDVT